MALYVHLLHLSQDDSLAESETLTQSSHDLEESSSDSSEKGESSKEIKIKDNHKRIMIPSESDEERIEILKQNKTKT